MTDESSAEKPTLDPRIKQLPARLRLAMNGIAVRTLAVKAGIAEGTLRNLLSGGIPRLDNILRIADAAEVSAAWLAAGEGQMRLREAPPKTILMSEVSAFCDLIDQVENLLKREEAIPVPPARILRKPELIQAKQQLESIPYNDQARIHADWLLKHGFGQEPSAGRDGFPRLTMLIRLRRAGEALSEMEEEMGYRPPPRWREMIKNLVFSHGLDEAGAALLLDHLQLEFERRQ